MQNLNVLYLAFTILTIVSCGQVGPEAIEFGRDQCHFCKMTISDPKFGAELISEKGRVLKYDAVECLINHLDKDRLSYRRVYAIAYDKPGELIKTDSLYFVISPAFRSPMGANLASFSSDQISDLTNDLNLLNWDDTYKIIAGEN